MSMSFTTGSASRDTAAYGGFVDAIGGVATIVLAIIGLSGARPEMLVAIATIVFGAALLVQGGAILSEYVGIIFPEGAGPISMEQFGGSSISALFMAGAAGIVLGILALIGVESAILTSVSIIAFGAGLLVSSNSVSQLHALKRAAETSQGVAQGGAAVVAHEMASGSAGVTALAGLAAVVLGILALCDVHAIVLQLSALIALGATLVLTGSTMSATVLNFMRPSRSATVSTATRYESR